METTTYTTAHTHTAAGAGRFESPHTRQAFGTVRALVAAYGLLGVGVLVTVAVLAMTGHAVTSFMWGRSAGVFASAAVAYWLTGRAARGARWAYLRMRIISLVVPPAIIAIDVLPGTLPAWFVLLQATCALAIGAAAFPLNGARLRAAFGKAR
ncbi:hypothetical protein HXP44_18910 [Streptomyces sioyaensis]|uniref:Uncharacterized protein n=1 Tax=Streptomyces sioyaensis TaxID=67364 RepID=A0A4Q1QQ65_9ACTN|nr:hypothetical protein [Streptomyces sioyaensis]MBM4794082.1 hypothetical protein [Streptomyces sioyaensis]RXS57912.1 hypothetical protein EST54_32410 [Streptomyces sioyaensis]